MYFKDDIISFILTNLYIIVVSFSVVYALVNLLMHKQNKLWLYGKIHSKSQSYKNYNLYGGFVVLFSSMAAIVVFSILGVLDTFIFIKLGAFFFLFVCLGCFAHKIKSNAFLLFLMLVVLAGLLVWSMNLSIVNLNGFFGVYEVDAISGFLLSIVIIVSCIHLFVFINKLEGLGLIFALLMAIIYCNLALFNADSLLFYINVSVFTSLLSLLGLQVFTTNKIHWSKGGAFFIGLYVALQLIWGITQGHKNDVQNSISFYIAVFSYPIVVILQMFAVKVFCKITGVNKAVDHFHEYLLKSRLSKFQVLLSVLGQSAFLVLLSLKLINLTEFEASVFIVMLACVTWGLFIYFIRLKYSPIQASNG